MRLLSPFTPTLLNLAIHESISVAAFVIYPSGYLDSPATRTSRNGKRPRTQRFYTSSSSTVSSTDAYSIPNNEGQSFSRPFFRVYYNDVYEVQLPPRHRFPMKKYEQVRKQLQRWIAELPKEEQNCVHCGECTL